MTQTFSGSTLPSLCQAAFSRFLLEIRQLYSASEVETLRATESRGEVRDVTRGVAHRKGAHSVVTHPKHFDESGPMCTHPHTKRDIRAVVDRVARDHTHGGLHFDDSVVDSTHHDCNELQQCPPQATLCNTSRWCGTGGTCLSVSGPNRGHMT